ncbi:hypothetical protein [Haliangium sp. UPWRP_2]|uniref:hypothetical protein n=1 Tax=Haliangium sp. UPWRP_2 TaxID=1931276 RepID=UPI0011B1FE83|nr:hypothetical protein [Haliangium sp. UPWRP_2]
MPPKPGSGLPMLYYFPGAPDSYGDNLDDELKELLAQTADRPEHKQIHETLLQQRAARLQLRILAEQAAQQAAHAQQIQKEAERRTAEVQQQSKEVREAFAKAVRKRRKRDAKEAKRQGIDWSAWLPLFKVATSALTEMVVLYLKLRPTIAEMEKQGRESGVKLFLLLEFFKAMEKRFYPEASAQERAEPVAPTTAAETAEVRPPAPPTAPPHPEPASVSPAEGSPMTSPESWRTTVPCECEADEERGKKLREMGIFERSAEAPAMSAQAAATIGTDSPQMNQPACVEEPAAQGPEGRMGTAPQMPNSSLAMSGPAEATPAPITATTVTQAWTVPPEPGAGGEPTRVVPAGPLVADAEPKSTLPLTASQGEPDLAPTRPSTPGPVELEQPGSPAPSQAPPRKKRHRQGNAQDPGYLVNLA